MYRLLLLLLLWREKEAKFTNVAPKGSVLTPPPILISLYLYSPAVLLLPVNTQTHKFTHDREKVKKARIEQRRN